VLKKIEIDPLDVEPYRFEQYDFKYCPTRLDNKTPLDVFSVAAAVHVTRGKLNKMTELLGKRRGVIHDFIFSNFNLLQFYRDVLDSEAEELREELRNIAMSSMANYYTTDEEGQPVLTLPEMDDPEFRAKMSAISKLTTEDFEGGRRGLGKRVKFELYPKLPAIQALLGERSKQHVEIDSADSPVSGDSNISLSFKITTVASGRFIPAPVEQISNNRVIEVDYAEEPNNG